VGVQELTHTLITWLVGGSVCLMPGDVLTPTGHDNRFRLSSCPVFAAPPVELGADCVVAGAGARLPFYRASVQRI
jgi:hypothetical protein